LLKWYFQ